MTKDGYTNISSNTQKNEDDKLEKKDQEEQAAPHEPRTKSRAKWDKTAAFSNDSLLVCLEILSVLLGRDMSASAFKAGLPLKDEHMTPDLFIRAAEKAGLSSRLMHRKLTSLTPYVLPCVLLLKGDKACILVNVTKDGMAEIIIPETGVGSTKVSLEDLDLLYSGYVLFVRPMYQYDQRSADLEIERPLEWFWGVIWKFWPVYVKVALSAILVNVFAIASPLFTMNVYDRVIANRAMDTLTVLSIGIAIVYLFDFLLKTLRVFFVDSAGKNADVILASRLLEHVMGMKLASRPTSSGSFANQLREFETLRDFFSSATLVAVVDLPFVFLFLLVIYWVGGAVVWVPVACIPLVIVGSWLIHAPLSAWVKRSFRESSQKHALLVETIYGLETIKTFGAEGYIQKDWERFVSQSSNSSNFLKFFAALAVNWSGLIQQLGYVGVIIYGVVLISAGEMSMGALVACSILVSRAMVPLTQVVGLLTRFHQSQAALQALNKIVSMPVERPKGLKFLHRPTLKGGIELRDVSFAYPGQKTLALKNFSLKVSPGEKIGVLGRIGSGKSTFEKLVLNLYEPQEGSVFLDDTDIRQIDPADLRKNIGYISQDIFLFFGTIRDNITLGLPHVTEEELVRAATISGVIDFVKQHPQGFDMHIGEGGGTLSGGQRQAVAVARALVRDPSILLLDEPTGMMDHVSEAKLIAHLEPYVASKTVIVITHRMSLLRLVNRLVIVDGGKVVADGARDEVLKTLSASQIRSS